MVKVSVIVVTYNQREFIGRALDSVLAQQTDFDLEIVVGDDGSTDGTRAVCEAYAARHPQIRLMPEAPNKGVARNYFDCLEACRGEYVADCAGDDAWCDPQKLARQVALLDAHPEVALTHTAWRTRRVDTGEEGLPVVQRDLPTIVDGRVMLRKLLRHDRPNPIHLCTALYRRDKIMALYEANRDFCRSQCSEDFTIEALLSAHHRVAYEPRVTLLYSVGSPQSVSTPADRARSAAFYRQTLLLTDALGRLTAEPRAVYSDALQRLYSYALAQAVAARSAAEVAALDDARRALQLRPRLKARLRRLIWNLGITI